MKAQQECKHHFTKMGFKITREGRKQRYQCQKCGITVTDPSLAKK